MLVKTHWGSGRRIRVIVTEPSASSMTAFWVPWQSMLSTKRAPGSSSLDRHHPIRLTVALHDLAAGERVVGHEVGVALAEADGSPSRPELPATLGSGAPGVTSLRTWKEPNR